MIGEQALRAFGCASGVLETSEFSAEVENRTTEEKRRERNGYADLRAVVRDAEGFAFEVTLHLEALYNLKPPGHDASASDGERSALSWPGSSSSFLTDSGRKGMRCDAIRPPGLPSKGEDAIGLDAASGDARAAVPVVNRLHADRMRIRMIVT